MSKLIGKPWWIFAATLVVAVFIIIGVKRSGRPGPFAFLNEYSPHVEEGDPIGFIGLKDPSNAQKSLRAQIYMFKVTPETIGNRVRKEMSAKKGWKLEMDTGSLLHYKLEEKVSSALDPSRKVILCLYGPYTPTYLLTKKPPEGITCYVALISR